MVNDNVCIFFVSLSIQRDQLSKDFFFLLQILVLLKEKCQSLAQLQEISLN